MDDYLSVTINHDTRLFELIYPSKRESFPYSEHMDIQRLRSTLHHFCIDPLSQWPLHIIVALLLG